MSLGGQRADGVQQSAQAIDALRRRLINVTIRECLEVEGRVIDRSMLYLEWIFSNSGLRFGQIPLPEQATDQTLLCAEDFRPLIRMLRELLEHHIAPKGRFRVDRLATNARMIAVLFDRATALTALATISS